MYFDYGGLTTTVDGPDAVDERRDVRRVLAGVGNLYMANTLLAGGQIQYQQEGAATGPGSGNMVFRNVSQESGNTDFMQINSNGYTFYGFGPIELDNVQQPDNTSTTAALINYNATGTYLSGVRIDNSASVSAVAVRITAGSIDHYLISGCNECSSTVVDANNLPMGSGMSESGGGWDIVTDKNFVNVWDRLCLSRSAASHAGNRKP